MRYPYRSTEEWQSYGSVIYGNFAEFHKILAALCCIFKKDIRFRCYLGRPYETYLAESKNEEQCVLKILSIYKPVLWDTGLIYLNENGEKFPCSEYKDIYAVFPHEIIWYFPTARERIEMKAWLEKTLQEYDPNFKLEDYI